jgi:hypothetical protein
MRRFWLKLCRRRRLHADLETELAFHRDAAQGQGNPIGLSCTTAIREEALDLWRFTLLEDLGRDLPYAVRRLTHSPASTITALLSVGLGIGLNTAIFNLVNTVLVGWLRVDRPGELEQITVSDSVTERAAFGYPMYKRIVEERLIKIGARLRTPAYPKVMIDCELCTSQTQR